MGVDLGKRRQSVSLDGFGVLITVHLVVARVLLPVGMKEVDNLGVVGGFLLRHTAAAVTGPVRYPVEKARSD